MKNMRCANFRTTLLQFTTITTTAITVVLTESILGHDTSYVGNILWNYPNHGTGSIVFLGDYNDAVESLKLWR